MMDADRARGFAYGSMTPSDSTSSVIHVSALNQSALVPYAAQEMFALVADIEAYPEFIPWCVSAAIRSQEANVIEAELGIGKGAIKTSFTTRNRLHPNERIDLSLVRGPFKHLHGHWRFEAGSASLCRVTLELDFDFSSLILRKTVGQVFDEVARRMVDAFTVRASRVYGKRTEDRRLKSEDGSQPNQH